MGWCAAQYCIASVGSTLSTFPEFPFAPSALGQEASHHSKLRGSKGPAYAAWSQQKDSRLICWRNLPRWLTSERVVRPVTPALHRSDKPKPPGSFWC